MSVNDPSANANAHVAVRTIGTNHNLPKKNLEEKRRGEERRDVQRRKLLGYWLDSSFPILMQSGNPQDLRYHNEFFHLLFMKVWEGEKKERLKERYVPALPPCLLETQRRSYEFPLYS